MKISKKIFSATIITFVLLLFVITPFILLAQTIDYVPISPVEGLTTEAGGLTLAGYLQRAFTFALGIAAVLAIIKISIGGIRYITSSSGDKTGEAKADIWNAILGLLLILSTYIILNQVNPEILRFKLGSTTSALIQKINVG